MRWLKTRLWSEHADLIWGGFKDKKHLIYIYTLFFPKSLTSSPRASSISLFSLSPGPMCLSAKSSCLGSILSICLEEAAADVLRPRAAVVVFGDAAPCRILHWSFQTTRLLSLTRLHGAPGFTDLAKKIPQDLAQLCISKSLRKTSPQEKKKQNKNNTTTWWRLVLPSLLGAEFSPPSSHSRTDAIPAGDSANSFKLQSLYNCTVAQERTNQSGACCVTRLMSPGQTAAKLSHVRFFFFFLFFFFFFAGERIVKVQKPLTRFIRCRGVLTDSGVKRDSRLHYDTQIQ